MACARAVPLALVRTVPVAAWLAGLVALSAVVRFAVALRMPAPWIMVDELIYSELARGIASGAGFVVRGEAVGVGYGAVYPLLISPAYLLDSLEDAHVAAQAINAVVISLAAVPAYLLARRLVAPPLALLAATLSLAVPSLFYAGTVMTENAFYPVFLLAVLALVRALEAPTPARAAVLFGIVGVAFLTRPQAVAFVPAILVAPLLMGRARLATYRWLYGGLAATAAGVLGAAALAGRSPRELLGAYKAASEFDYRVEEVARWVLYHLGELDLYVGVVPFAALVLLLARARTLDVGGRAFAAAAATVIPVLVLQVGAFASIPSVLRVEERNLFYVAPLFFVALAYWLERGVPRRAAAVACGGAVALLAVVPYERLINISAVSDTFALLALWRWAELWQFSLDRVVVAVLVLGALLAAVFVLVPRRALVAVPAYLLVLYALAAQPIDARTEFASRGSLFQGINRTQPDWVDRATAGPGEVAVLWTGLTDALTVFQNELHSRSVGRVYHVGPAVPGGLPQRAVGIGLGDGVLRAADDSTIDAPYLLADESLALEGRVVARDPGRGMRVLRLRGPARVSGVLLGVYGDKWSRPEFVYRGFRCEGDLLRVSLGSDAGLFDRPQRVVAYARGRAVARAAVRADLDVTALTVPLSADADGVCLVRFRVLDTAVPAAEDPRELGIRVLGFERR